MNIVAQGERLQVPVAATIGMFDGVHVGHRSVLAFLRSEAGRRGLSSAAITFRRHPQAVLHPDVDFPVLMTPEAKLEALAETGIDYAIVLDFDKQLSELSAREFIRLIRDTYGVRLLLVGYDHRFGHNRSDTFADYVGYGGGDADSGVRHAVGACQFVGNPSAGGCRRCGVGRADAFPSLSSGRHRRGRI